jgi:hypothetical protein
MWDKTYNKLHQSYQDKELLDQLKTYFRQEADKLALKELRQGNNVEHVRPALEFIDKIFSQMKADFEVKEPKKPRGLTSR